MANFGFSVGDFLVIGNLAWKVYRACKTASAEFEEVAREVISLHAAIKELEDEAGKERSLIKEASLSKKAELALLVNNVNAVLDQLDKLVAKYSGLAGKHRRTWDRLRFGLEGLSEVRAKIVVHTSSINLFLTTLSNESLIRIEQKLDEIVREFQRGDRDASSIAHLDEDVPEAEVQWQELKKELIDEGFTRHHIEVHKDWIKAHLRRTLEAQSASDAMVYEAQPAPLPLLSRPGDMSTEAPPMTAPTMDPVTSSLPPSPAVAPHRGLFFHHWTPPVDVEPGSATASTFTPTVASHNGLYFHHWKPPSDVASGSASISTFTAGHSHMGSFDESSIGAAVSSTGQWPSMLNQASLKRRASSPPLSTQRHLSSPATGSSYAQMLIPSLRHRSSNESLANSVHSDVTEYDGEGRVTKRTVTQTTSYTPPQIPRRDSSSSTHGIPAMPLPPPSMSPAPPVPPPAPGSAAPIPTARKQSKWTQEEGATIMRLRGEGTKWEDISKQLPGRSAISCRLHFQNYLQPHTGWDEEKKTKFARLYERFKADMWSRIAGEMSIPWRTAESMFWQIGEEDMARRAGITNPYSFNLYGSGSHSRQNSSDTRNSSPNGIRLPSMVTPGLPLLPLTPKGSSESLPLPLP